MVKHPRNIVGLAVRRIRNAKGLSQSALAARLQRQGWPASRGLVAKVESGERWVADFEAVFLAKVLRIPIQKLYSLPDKDTQAKALIFRLERTLD